MSNRKQIVLGAYFPGVNHDTVWSDPASGSHIAWESFEHWARTAERGRLDLLFLAKAIERIGDHSKNVAELIIYLVEGKDVRHQTMAEIESAVL